MTRINRIGASTAICIAVIVVIAIVWAKVPSPLTDAIHQNTIGNSEGFPLGVPTSYDWYTGRVGAFGSTPPSNFTAMTGWGQVYPETGQPIVPATIQISGFQTWLRLTNGTWVKAQDQVTNGLMGAHYSADFHGDTVAMAKTVQPDGSVTFDAPTSGYNDHFYQGDRGVYTAGTVDGVFVIANMKASAGRFIGNFGADWWLDKSAPYVVVNGVQANSPGVGMSNWLKLTTSYRTFYFTSLTEPQLQANLPPPLR